MNRDLAYYKGKVVDLQSALKQTKNKHGSYYRELAQALMFAQRQCKSLEMRFLKGMVLLALILFGAGCQMAAQATNGLGKDLVQISEPYVK